MSRLVARWDRFWFASQPTSTLALFRIVFGLLVIVWALALLPDLLTFFGRGGIVPRAPDYGRAGLPWTWGLLNGAPGDVMVEAEHTCMSLRGVEKPGSLTVTTQFRGSFRDDANEQLRFLSLVRGGQR